MYNLKTDRIAYIGIYIYIYPIICYVKSKLIVQGILWYLLKKSKLCYKIKFLLSINKKKKKRLNWDVYKVFIWFFFQLLIFATLALIAIASAQVLITYPRTYAPFYPYYPYSYSSFGYNYPLSYYSPYTYFRR